MTVEIENIDWVLERLKKEVECCTNGTSAQLAYQKAISLFESALSGKITKCWHCERRVADKETTPVRVCSKHLVM